MSNILYLYILYRESTLEITKGIREYFNITLGLQLLYKWERPQFIQIMNDNPETLPSQLYGAFHLLRLFGKALLQSSHSFVQSCYLDNNSECFAYSETRWYAVVRTFRREEHTTVIIALSRLSAIFAEE